jgi:hypothetical protein
MAFGLLVSKREVLNEQLTQTSMDVLNELGTMVNVTTIQKNVISIIGNEKPVVLKGVTMGNAAKVNVTALMASTISGTLQVKLIQELAAEIKQKGGTLGVSVSDEEIKNAIGNVVNQTITARNLLDIKNHVEQSNELIILNPLGPVVVETFKMKNEFNGVIEIVQTMTSKIISELESKQVIDSKVLQENADILTQIVRLMRDAVWGFVAILFALVVAFIFLVKYSAQAFEKVVDVSGTSVTASFTTSVNSLTSTLGIFSDPTVIIVLAGAIFGGIALTTVLSNKSGFSPAYDHIGSKFVQEKKFVNNTSPDAIPDIAKWESLV